MRGQLSATFPVLWRNSAEGERAYRDGERKRGLAAVFTCLDPTILQVASSPELLRYYSQQMPLFPLG